MLRMIQDEDTQPQPGAPAAQPRREAARADTDPFRAAIDFFRLEGTRRRPPPGGGAGQDAPPAASAGSHPPRPKAASVP